eukprot:SAG11_NODE_2909_length_2845_cov_3.209395_4_plen_40_part_00
MHENLYTGYWHSGTVLFFFVLDLRTVCNVTFLLNSPVWT